MATLTWNGQTGNYFDPAQWSPQGVPLYGSDTVATIGSGTVTLSNAEPNGITLNLTASRTIAGMLILDNAALGPAMTLYAIGNTTLEYEGYDTNYGSIVVQGGTLVMFAGSLGQLNQYGAVKVAAEVQFHGIFNNDGLIDVAGGAFLLYGSIIGSGTIAFTAGGSMDVDGPIATGQTIVLPKGSLELFDFAEFQGTVAQFTSSAASITVDGLAFDTASYVDDSTGEHLDLTSAGTVVGRVQLASTPATQYIVTHGPGSATITPAQIYSDGSIPGVIAEGVVTIRNAEPNGQTVSLGTGATLALESAALGPSLQLVVGNGHLSVAGYDTNYGAITSSAAGVNLDISIGVWSQLNQEGTIQINSTTLSSGLLVEGLGTLHNDGQIIIGPGSNASFNATVTGTGTITVDHATAYLSADLGSQTIEFLGGLLSSRPGLTATIKDWNSQGVIDFSFPGGTADALLFNQTSPAGGDLQVFKAGAVVGDVHLLGSYTTAEFQLLPTYPGTTRIGIAAS